MPEHVNNIRSQHPLAYSPRQAADVSSLSLRKLMKDIANGRLRSYRKGRRRIILAEDLRRYLRSGQ